MTQPRKDIRQEVTDTILDLMESADKWQKGWKASGFRMPYNPTTNHSYRGGNALHLMAVAHKKGYSDPRWVTWKQADNQGWQVRHGEKGTRIEYWEYPPKAEGEEKDERRAPIHRVYTVFNAAQVEGIPPLVVEPRQPWEVIEAGEKILSHSGAALHHDQADRAFYRQDNDSIHLPPKEAFTGPAEYYGTALHELSHWSGHPTRLNRPTLVHGGSFGKPEYAREELRAELASLFMAAESGIPYDSKNSAAYLKSWVSALKHDKNEIFHAARDAQDMADYCLAFEQGKGPVTWAEKELTRNAHSGNENQRG